jgi:flagellar motor switch protein FliM
VSGKATNSMSREEDPVLLKNGKMGAQKIQQLLMAVGTEPMEDAAPVEATEYDWHKSHYFNNEQLGRLTHFTEAVAVEMAQKFSKFCRSEFNATVASITQHYVSDFLSQLSDGEQKDYYIPFGAGKGRMCGLVGMSKQTALNWARQLLGDSESEKDQDRDLSQLEETLLLDLVSALVEVFSGIDKSFDFHSAKSIVKAGWPLEVNGTEELCKISFNVKKAGSEKSSETYFLILCGELRSITGKTEQYSGGFSEEAVSKVILGHLHKMPVLITCQLASTMITFEEIMGLQEDDILLLDKRVDQPMELIVDGRTVYYGYPAKSAGKYAVTITKTAAAFGGATEEIKSNMETK